MALLRSASLGNRVITRSRASFDPAGIPIGIGAGPEIVLDGHLGEHPPPLHHLADPSSHPVRRVLLGDVFAVEADLSLGHLALMDVEQAGDGAKRGRLAGAVGAEQGDDLPIRDLEGDPAQNQHNVVVDDLEVLY